jgi:cysteine desulfurase
LGHSSTGADVHAVAEVIAPIVARARSAGLAGMRRSAARLV